MAKIYTDACLYNGNGGIGIYCETPGIGSSKFKKNYPGMTTQSLELDAIQIALSKVGLYQNATIFTDSTYAFESIVSSGDINNNSMWHTTKNKFMHCHELLKVNYNTLQRYKRKGKDIKLEYSKGHSGIFGNEQADKLAGIAAGKPCSSHVVKALALVCNDVASSTLQEFTISIPAISDNNAMPIKKKLLESPIVSEQPKFWSPFGQTVEIIDTVSAPAQSPLSIRDRISAINISNTETFNNEDIIPSEEPDELSDWPSYKKKSKKKKLIKAQSPEIELPKVESITQQIDNNLLDPDIYWQAPYKMSEISDISPVPSFISIDKEQTNNRTLTNDLKEWNLFLSCIECSETILLIYPEGHKITTSEYLDIQSDKVFALTKCRQCITKYPDLIEGVPQLVNVQLELEKLVNCFFEISLSPRMIVGSLPHKATEKIAWGTVDILLKHGSARLVSILIITKLCGRGTRSLTVNVDKMELFGYLENGFL